MKVIRWSLLWSQSTILDGHKEHLVYENCIPVLFRTRKEARNFAKIKYGYIKERKDLRAEPHCWRIPTPIRVQIECASY